ncbi:MAG: nuclear transport factor 2 family protein [Candidatus Thorarchaeota archaeon]
MTREENIETARNFVGFLEQRRFKEFVELFAENGKWIHPYHSGLFPAETVGPKEIHDAIKTAADNFDEIRFPIDEILPFEDPSRIAMKHTGKLKLKNGNGTYENDYLTLFHFDEHGKILEWIEYYNPITAAKAFGLMDKIQ